MNTVWSERGYQKDDVEGGSSAAQPLYPAMVEEPQLRWGFIRKIYSIVATQLLLTVAVAAVVVSVDPIKLFFATTTAGLVVYFLLIIVLIIVMLSLSYFHRSHPWNYLLLAILTAVLSLCVGLVCAFTSGMVILESAILTAVVFISLTLYTFWAVKRGQDFGFLAPFLFGALMVLIVFGFIQVFFPMGKISVMIYGLVASLIFCGYIIYDTNNIIKRYSYDDYIWASVALYLDIINLFTALMRVFRAVN